MQSVQHQDGSFLPDHPLTLVGVTTQSCPTSGSSRHGPQQLVVSFIERCNTPNLDQILWFNVCAMYIQGLLGIRIETIRRVQTLLFTAICNKLRRLPQHRSKGRKERDREMMTWGKMQPGHKAEISLSPHDNIKQSSVMKKFELVDGTNVEKQEDSVSWRSVAVLLIS